MSALKTTYFHSLFCLFLWGASFQICQAQDSDSPLFEGPTYADVHRSINEKHKYVGPYDFQAGAILYQNKWHTQLAIKYDAYEGLLLLRHPRALGAPTLVVHTDLVSEFYLQKMHFIKLTFEDNSFESGFYEVLASTPAKSLYKKHVKKIQRKQKEGLGYFEFKDKPIFIMKEGTIFKTLKRPKPLQIESIITALEATKTHRDE